MKYQLTAPFFQVKSNGEHKLIAAGTYISVREFKALTPQKQAKCKPVQGKRELFSEDELDLAIELYLDHSDKGQTCVANNAEVIAQLLYINRDRPAASFSQLLNQIRGLDAYAPQKGLDNPSQTLVQKLHEVDPIRFPNNFVSQLKVENALDNLLREIRG